MKISNWLKPAVLSLGIAFSATSAQATVLALPTSNAMSTGTYNSFEVYSLDLLKQCAAAGDPRCLPAGPFPVQSSPGQIADQPVVLTSSSGYGGNMTSPFPIGTFVDNAFLTPTGNQSAFFEMTGGGEPGGTFAGDTLGLGRRGSDKQRRSGDNGTDDRVQHGGHFASTMKNSRERSTADYRSGRSTPGHSESRVRSRPPPCRGCRT